MVTGKTEQKSKREKNREARHLVVAHLAALDVKGRGVEAGDGDGLLGRLDLLHELLVLLLFGHAVPVVGRRLVRLLLHLWPTKCSSVWPSILIESDAR